jgi:hypothetical protein
VSGYVLGTKLNVCQWFVEMLVGQDGGTKRVAQFLLGLPQTFLRRHKPNLPATNLEPQSQEPSRNMAGKIPPRVGLEVRFGPPVLPPAPSIPISLAPATDGTQKA